MNTARFGLGVALTLLSLGVLFFAIVDLHAHQFVSAIAMALIGMALLGAAVELVRPEIGE